MLGGGGTILKFFKPVSFNIHRYTPISTLHQIHIRSFYFLFLKDWDVHLNHRYRVLNETHKHNIIPLIWRLILQKSWYFSSWEKYSQVQKLFKKASRTISTLTVMASTDPRLLLHQLLQLWWLQKIQTRNFMPLNQQLKEISKQKTHLISSAAHKSSNKKLPVRT